MTRKKKIIQDMNKSKTLTIVFNEYCGTTSKCYIQWDT